MKLVVLVPLLLASMLLQINQVSAETKYLTSVSDSFVSTEGPSNNYGSGQWEKKLLVGDTVGFTDLELVQVTYIMFDISGLPVSASVISMKLRLYSYIVTRTFSIGVHACQDCSWDENNITWENSPAYAAEALRVIDVEDVNAVIRTAQGNWNEWGFTGDISRLTSTNGKLTLVIKSEKPYPPVTFSGGNPFASKVLAFFYSKENGEFGPELEIEYTLPVASTSALGTTVTTTVSTTASTTGNPVDNRVLTILGGVTALIAVGLGGFLVYRFSKTRRRDDLSKNQTSR